MSLLLQLLAFGPSFENMQDDKIVSQTKKIVIMHIRSCERIKTVFTVEGCCLVGAVDGGVQYACASTVF